MATRLLLALTMTLFAAGAVSGQVAPPPPHRATFSSGGTFLGTVVFNGTGPGSTSGDTGTADAFDADGNHVGTGSWIIDDQGNMLLSIAGALVTLHEFYQSLNPAVVQGPGGGTTGAGGATWDNPDYQ